MMLSTILPVLAMAIACKTDPLATAQSAQSSDDISRLSDEFDQPDTLGDWPLVSKAEGWNISQLQSFDIGRSRKGWMTMVPYTSTWYQDYRGVMAFKQVQGDFVVTTKLEVSRRDGNGAPRSQFSLAGIMVRTPRGADRARWRPGGENYVFLSIGAADVVNTFQFEVKTTVNSGSSLITSPTSSGTAIIRVARIGSTMLMLKKVNGQWSVHRRYSRPDFPDTVQVGLTCYTDWPSASQLQPERHNGTVIKTGYPDLIARADFVRFSRPSIPKSLAGPQLVEPTMVSDAQILQYLGRD